MTLIFYYQYLSGFAAKKNNKWIYDLIYEENNEKLKVLNQQMMK